MVEKSTIKKLVNRLLNLYLAILGILALWIILKVSTYATFSIPSSSMEPTLFPGDMIIVNKWILGGRIFNIFNLDKNPDPEVSRLWGVRQLRRNDIIVFNSPFVEINGKRKIGLCIDKYYAKRCLAVAGDTIEIRGGYYKVRGIVSTIGFLDAQRKIANMDTVYFKDIMGAYVGEREFADNTHPLWTIQEMGPLLVPYEGLLIKMDSTNYSLYANLIEWEQKKEVSMTKRGVTIGDSLIVNYTFLKDYCFVGGDNVIDSNDSRYWGLLPEDFVVGVTNLIWGSKDPSTGKWRNERIMKTI